MFNVVQPNGWRGDPNEMSGATGRVAEDEGKKVWEPMEMAGGMVDGGSQYQRDECEEVTGGGEKEVKKGRGWVGSMWMSLTSYISRGQGLNQLERLR